MRAFRKHNGGMYMIPNAFIPRFGVSIAFAASLFGAGAGQLVVQASAVNGASVPYIVCGVDTQLDSGGSQSILLTSGVVPVAPAQIDPAAIGQTFTIHGPTVARCGAGYAFQGVADRSANTGSVALPASLAWLRGDRPGPVDGEMETLNCDGSSTQGCSLLLTVETGSDAG